MEKKVVARLRDGTMHKGTTVDFAPNGALFHITIAEGPDAGQTVAIETEMLKALFFVRVLSGRHDYQERKLLSPGDLPGQKVTVTFHDGETIRGIATGLNLSLPGFFLFPADRESNNKRIFIMRGAVRHVRVEKGEG